MKIGYLGLGDASGLQYGLNLVVETAKIAGYSPEPASRGVTLATYDVLLVSLYWWEHIYEFARMLADSGIDPAKRRPIIIVGGMQPSMNPLPISPAIHYAVGGDGEVVIARLLAALDRGETEPDLDGVWWPGRGGPVKAAKAETVMYAPYVEIRGLEHLAARRGKLRTVAPITMIEMGRGCKHRCRFCALAHQKPWRELSFDQVRRALSHSQTKSVCLFSPERSEHSAFSKICGEVNMHGLHDTASDIRLERVAGVDRIGKVQVGLEGVSERLRRAVGKPLTREQLASAVQSVHETPSIRHANHMNMHAYLIGGLPGEAPSDYDEFAGDIEAVNGRVPPGFLLRMTINWFIPQPFTPLQFAPVDPFAAWRKPSWWGVAHGENRDRYAFKVGLRATLANPTTWLLALIATRADASHWPLIFALATNPTAKKILAKLRHGDLIKLCERAGLPLARLVGEQPAGEPMPWEHVWSHERAAPEYTRRQWLNYQRLLKGEAEAA